MIISPLSTQLSSFPVKEIINKCIFVEKEKSDEFSQKDLDFEKIAKSYQKTIDELLSLNPNEEQYTILVSCVSDFSEEEKYIDVAIKNDYFVQDPPKNLNAWGGNCNDENDCPDGHYNVNWCGYQRVYGMSGKNRDRLLLSNIEVTPEVMNICDGSISKILAEILYELTFHGFTEEESKKFWDSIESDIKDGEFYSLEDLKELFSFPSEKSSSEIEENSKINEK